MTCFEVRVFKKKKVIKKVLFVILKFKKSIIFLFSFSDWKNVTKIHKVTNNSIEISWTLSPEEKCQGIKWEIVSGICQEQLNEKTGTGR